MDKQRHDIVQVSPREQDLKRQASVEMPKRNGFILRAALSKRLERKNVHPSWQVKLAIRTA